ncbi:unnamed protein product [Amoebophrya sp. A120]|nr:unnamed protein product [Amoebophrya sp. A120]|eukprot:GSA120T00018029001.1
MNSPRPLPLASPKQGTAARPDVDEDEDDALAQRHQGPCKHRSSSGRTACSPRSSTAAGRSSTSGGRGAAARTSGAATTSSATTSSAVLAANPNYKSKLCVIKIGTSSLLTDDARLKLPAIGRLIETIMRLRRDGHRVVLVSSGAQGCGRIKLQLAEKPTTVSGKQAVAAAGQSYLMRIYEDLFDVASAGKQKVAQLLITRRDFSAFSTFENIRNTVFELLRYNVIPILNENDSVHPTTGLHEKFGDNDQLAALTAVNLEADWLFLLTDVDYVYTCNPGLYPDLAKPIREVRTMQDLAPVETVTKVEGTSCSAATTAATARPSSPTLAPVAPAPPSQPSSTGAVGAGPPGTAPSSGKWGTGGMETKLVAAKMAAVAGIQCVLVNGAEPERILDFLSEYNDHSNKQPTTTTSASRGQGVSSRKENTVQPEQQPAEQHLQVPGFPTVAVQHQKEPGRETGEQASNEQHHAAETDTTTNRILNNGCKNQEQVEGARNAKKRALIGTFFHAMPSASTLKYQRRWILALPAKGKLFVNPGAFQALQNKKSLLAVGIVAVEGDFLCGDCVQIYLVRDTLPGTTAGGATEMIHAHRYGEQERSQAGVRPVVRELQRAPLVEVDAQHDINKAGTGSDRAVTNHLLNLQDVADDVSERDVEVEVQLPAQINPNISTSKNANDGAETVQELLVATNSSSAAATVVSASTSVRGVSASAEGSQRMSGASARPIPSAWTAGGALPPPAAALTKNRAARGRSADDLLAVEKKQAQHLELITGATLVAQGIVEFTTEEMLKIRGLRSTCFQEKLGYVAEPEVAHRDNIILLHQ